MRDSRKPGERAAVASLLMGAVSLLTCGGLLAGPTVGLVLGIVAIKRARQSVTDRGSKQLAIIGVLTNAVALLTLPLISAFAIPNLIKSRQAANEAAAIARINAIVSAEKLYALRVGNGQFADLRELVSKGMVEPGLASEEAGGYRFRATRLNIPGRPAMFDVTAEPVSDGVFGAGKHSFGSNETLAFYREDGIVDLKGTPDNRIPVNGIQIR